MLRTFQAALRWATRGAKRALSRKKRRPPAISHAQREAAAAAWAELVEKAERAKHAQ